MALASYFMKRLIQMFRESLMIIGINAIRVPTILIKLILREAPMNTLEITKAATPKAIPTP